MEFSLLSSPKLHLFDYRVLLVWGDEQWVGAEQGAGGESAQWAPEAPAGPADGLPGEQ